MYTKFHSERYKWHVTELDNLIISDAIISQMNDVRRTCKGRQAMPRRELKLDLTGYQIEDHSHLPRKCVCGRLTSFSFLSLLYPSLDNFDPLTTTHMESSTSSHNNTQAGSSRGSTINTSSDRSVPKDSKQILVSERSYELDTLYGEPIIPQPTRQSWLTRTSRSFITRNPRTGAWITKVVLYVRGPRPKVDLPRT